MGPDPDPNPNPKPEPPSLQLTTFPTLKYQQQYSGAITPLHTLASIPFSWEQEPGKPLPCLTLALPSTKPSHDNLINKCLELPPRLLNVIEGPYNTLGRSVLQSSSFRSWRKKGVVNYKGKSEIYGGSFVFPSSLDDGDEIRKVVMVNNKKSHFWATIYETFKQVIPRRSTKCKKDAL